MKEREERHDVDFTRLGIFHFFLQTDDFKTVMKKLKSLAAK